VARGLDALRPHRGHPQFDNVRHETRATRLFIAALESDGWGIDLPICEAQAGGWIGEWATGLIHIFNVLQKIGGRHLNEQRSVPEHSSSSHRIQFFP
jgi:hypothetical protein